MDYKELIENLKTWEEEYISCTCGERNIKCQQFCLPDKDCLATQAVTAITDLISRAEAAEARCETLEKMVKEYQDVIIPGYRERAEKAEREILRLRDIMWGQGFIPFPPDD